ncbi:MAG: YggS family pyridoxal phosphate-dependent enzyme [Christensenellales bacterium]|jgi:pyridoxal phosphate enzyme (YggS family)
MGIARNIERIKNRIDEAAHRGGYDHEAVRLIAVTKFAHTEQIRQVIENGVYDLGENKVQSLISKLESLPLCARWNFIGHLQKNKIKYLIKAVHMIHSVDSVALAQKIDQHAQKEKTVVPVLLQVNVAKEATKSGFYVEQLQKAVTEIAGLEHIRLSGLMSIMPLCDAGVLRPYFQEMRRLFVDIRQKQGDAFQWLSMGMSNDYEIAVEEGANMVRIGSAIFCDE